MGPLDLSPFWRYARAGGREQAFDAFITTVAMRHLHGRRALITAVEQADWYLLDSAFSSHSAITGALGPATGFHNLSSEPKPSRLNRPAASDAYIYQPDIAGGQWPSATRAAYRAR